MWKRFCKAALLYSRNWHMVLLASLLIQGRFTLANLAEQWGGENVYVLVALALYPLMLGCRWVYYRLVRALPVSPATLLNIYRAPGALRRALVVGLLPSSLSMLLISAILPVLAWIATLPYGVSRPLSGILILLLVVGLGALTVFLTMLDYLLPQYPNKPLGWLLVQSRRRVAGNVPRLLGYIFLSGLVQIVLLPLPDWLMTPAIILISPIFFLVLADFVADCITAPMRRLTCPKATSPQNRRYLFGAPKGAGN